MPPLALIEAAADPTIPQIAVASLGALILLCTSLIIAQLRAIGTKQTEQGTSITEMRTVLLGASGTPGLVDRVSALHQWKNEEQRLKLEAANAEIDRLREEERRHGPIDRRAS